MTAESVLNISLDKRFLGVFFPNIIFIIFIVRQNNNLSPRPHPSSGMLEVQFQSNVCNKPILHFESHLITSI